MSTTLISPQGPLDPVQTWRLEQLVAAGYPQYDAFVVSERTDIDLHLAARLLQNGCPADTALRILL